MDPIRMWPDPANYPGESQRVLNQRRGAGVVDEVAAGVPVFVGLAFGVGVTVALGVITAAGWVAVGVQKVNKCSWAVLIISGGTANLGSLSRAFQALIAALGLPTCSRERASQ